MIRVGRFGARPFVYHEENNLNLTTVSRSAIHAKSIAGTSGAAFKNVLKNAFIEAYRMH